MAIAVFVTGVSVLMMAWLVIRSYWLTPLKHRALSTLLEAPSNGYILYNKVIHSRFLPHQSSHSFTYPTVSLLVSLNALESHALDLGYGRIFGYGGLLWRLTGLRPSAYMESQAPGKSIKDKLVALLNSRGFEGSRDTLHDAWMLTMPSYFGFEGINPLTVYLCYQSPEKLWLVVLEIHNTFGERHVHILEVGKSEDEHLSGGYNHQWTFPRQFHVSPFNDRSGFYTVSITTPSHSPSSPHNIQPVAAPRPSIRIHLYTEDMEAPEKLGPLKLTAMLRPVSSVPLTTPNLLFALLRQPFLLFMSLPRILYQAWILHYKKRLDTYARPDPQPAVDGWGDGSVLCGGIGWQPEGVLEMYARRIVESFLQRRADETGVTITLIPGDPSQPRRVFEPQYADNVPTSDSNLIISYLSPRFFTTLLSAPSPKHALIVGHIREKLFIPSSPKLFLFIFSTPHHERGESPRANSEVSLPQRVRGHALASSFLSNPEYPIPRVHPLDTNSSSLKNILTAIYLLASMALDALEKRVYTSVKARFVPGQEPWLRWERAARMLSDDDGLKAGGQIPNDLLEKEDGQQYKLGSVART